MSETFETPETNVQSVLEAQEAARLAYIKAQQDAARILIPQYQTLQQNLAEVLSSEVIGSLRERASFLPENTVKFHFDNLIESLEALNRVIRFELQSQNNNLLV